MRGVLPGEEHFFENPNLDLGALRVFSCAAYLAPNYDRPKIFSFRDEDVNDDFKNLIFKKYKLTNETKKKECDVFEQITVN